MLAIWSVIMFGLGVIITFKFGTKPAEITNNIGKIKRNDGNLDIQQVQEKTEPKKGLFKRIFKRKNK